MGSNIEPDVYTCAGVDLRNGTQPILDRNGTCVVVDDDDDDDDVLVSTCNDDDDDDVLLLLLTW